MNLYLITQDKKRDYDCYFGYVIRAESPERVVEMAQKAPGDEKAKAWILENVELLAAEVEGEEKEILSDFNAG